MFLYPIPKKYLNLQTSFNNNTYRFGDILFKLGPAWERAGLEITSNKPKFGNTILFEYLKNVSLYNTQPINYRFLQKITIKKYRQSKLSIPEVSDLVVHLRLGDVAETNFPYGIENLKKIYFDFFEKFEISNLFNRVVISTALNYGNYNSLDIYEPTLSSWKNSLELLDIITNLLNKKQIPWCIHSTSFPDEEFWYLINSKSLILSGSNFSKLASECLIEQDSITNDLIFKNIRSISVDWEKNCLKEKTVNKLSLEQKKEKAKIKNIFILSSKE